MISTSAWAQTQQTENTWMGGAGFARPAATVESLGWLTGHWVGEGLGGECEELWGAPKAGAILGAFRLCQENQTVFTEHFVLMEHQGSLLLKLKHFGPDLRGWEEKDRSVEFPLIQVMDREVRFDGITYRRVSDQELHVFVAISDKEKNVREAKFVFHKHP
jgi:hypothetical protein